MFRIGTQPTVSLHHSRPLRLQTTGRWSFRRWSPYLHDVRSLEGQRMRHVRGLGENVESLNALSNYLFTSAKENKSGDD